MGEKQPGFSLIELVTVIVLASVIFIFVGSPGNPKGLELLAVRDDVVAGLFRAQQAAMARQSAANSIQFISNGSSVDVRENGASIDSYPFSLPTAVTLTVVTLNFDKLGRTSATVLTLTSSGGSATITVEDSGYAH